jgi:hypothetical protein
VEVYYFGGIKRPVINFVFLIHYFYNGWKLVAPGLALGCPEA